MDSIVEENGNSSNVDEGHNLSTTASSHLQQQSHQSASSNSNATGNSVVPPPASVATSGPTVLASSVMQFIPAPAHGQQVQSVIQAANPASVIQTAATNAQAVASGKGGVLFLSKPNSTVIHTTSSNAVQIPPNFQCKIKPEPNTQHLDSNSEDSLTDEDSPHRRRDLTRRPSYHKIFNEISTPTDISAGTTLQMPETGGIPTISSTGGSTAGTFIPMQQESGPPFFIPTRLAYTSNTNSIVVEDQTRKREIRLQKNREAARECRRKKKEYIKCLENRVAVLENQNKALIEELKSLKELYCQTKND